FVDSYEPQDGRASNYSIRKWFILKDAEQNAPFSADRLPPGYAYGDTIKFNWSEAITPGSWARDDWPYSRKHEGSTPDDVASDFNYDDYIAVRLADTYL